MNERQITARRWIHGLIGLALLTACAGEVPAVTTETAKVSLADFGRLRWIEGQWRGAQQGGAPFYEAYRFHDDSTMWSYSFADSTMRTPRDSSIVALRGDTVTSGIPVAWRATTLDSVSVQFVRVGEESSGFRWTYVGPGAWTASLTFDSAGVPASRVYAMRAVPVVGRDQR